jgi:hypothetical protein
MINLRLSDLEAADVGLLANFAAGRLVLRGFGSELEGQHLVTNYQEKLLQSSEARQES